METLAISAFFLLFLFLWRLSQLLGIGLGAILWTIVFYFPGFCGMDFDDLGFLCWQLDVSEQIDACVDEIKQLLKTISVFIILEEFLYIVWDPCITIWLFLVFNVMYLTADLAPFIQETDIIDDLFNC